MKINKGAGFKVLNFIELSNWKTFAVTNITHLVVQRFCPVDNSFLRIICTLIGQNGEQKLRIGCCSVCGYVGYIDRPSKEWSTNFYFDTYALRYYKKKISTSGHRLSSMLKLLKSLPVNKSRPVCEIGCGTGRCLAALRPIGFSKLIGVENSRLRAEAARRNYGLSVITSPFESLESISQLEKEAPFSLMYSHHVLEHVYDPAEIIAAVSRLQRSGDWFINSLPNFYAEPTLTALLFLPHLHSFTKESFCRLLERYRYEIVNDAFTTDAEIYIAARKTDKSMKKSLVPKDYFNEALSKLTKGLGFTRENYSDSLRYLRCTRKMDVCRQSPAFLRGHMPALNKIFCRFYHRLDKNQHYCLLISDLEKRYTSEKESPLEIQFEGNIKLFYK